MDAIEIAALIVVGLVFIGLLIYQQITVINPNL